FAFTFSLSALIRIKAGVPLLTAHTSAYANFVCLGVFLYLIDHLGKALRPSGALRAVARQARTVIESVYPQRLAEESSGTNSAAPPEINGAEAALHLGGRQPTATIPSPTDGVVLAFDEAGLLSLAQHTDCVIEMVPQVGDHVAAGDPLFRIYRGGATLPIDA